MEKMSLESWQSKVHLRNVPPELNESIISYVSTEDLDHNLTIMNVNEMLSNEAKRKISNKLIYRLDDNHSPARNEKEMILYHLFHQHSNSDPQFYQKINLFTIVIPDNHHDISKNNFLLLKVVRTCKNITTFCVK